MYDSTFTPRGPTYLVGITPVQILGSANEQCTSYLVRCMATGYFSWTSQLNGTPVMGTPTAPANLVPSVNTIGMLVNAVQTFQLPGNVWLKSSVAGGFEVTPGEGA